MPPESDKAASAMNVDPMTTNYAALDLLLWQQQGSLVLSPKFQRRPVWSAGAKSYLIDTLLRGFPVAPLHIRLSESERGGAMREVIDGQQRLRTLFDFYEGKLRLRQSLHAPWAGKTFAQLPDQHQSQLKMYNFHVFQYQGLDDALVLEIFARMNTYSVALNAQELRNGKWFGDFKQIVYGLALEFLPYWREFAIFSEGALARMREAELVSELLVLQLDGLQDKKSSLDNFYSQLDEDWGKARRTWMFRKTEKPAVWLDQAQATNRLRTVLNEVAEAVGPVLRRSEFRRGPLFYTLYAAVYHRLYGVPGVDLPTAKRLLTEADRERLRLAVGELSDLLAVDPDVEELLGWGREFFVASSRQTDNIGPRMTRLRILWEQAGLG
jgi:Protein of unknown function DUF262